jgi:hypothetical protein
MISKVSKGNQGHSFSDAEKRKMEFDKRKEEYDREFAEIVNQARSLNKQADSALYDAYEGQEYDPEAIRMAKQRARDEATGIFMSSMKDDVYIPEGLVESEKMTQEEFDNARKNAIKKKLSKYDY